MLAIQAHCHAGHIQIPTEGIPLDAEVVVVFLPAAAGSDATFSAERDAALRLQSRSSFARTVLMNPAEDCWNDV